MLVLTRLEGERIRLECPDGTIIWVQVREICHGKVRIGIEAPKDVMVLREELIGRLPSKTVENQKEDTGSG